MVANSYTIYDKEGNHIVISYDMIKDSTFIVFMLGDKKPLMKLWKDHRSLIKGRIFFCCELGINYFSNHSVEITPGLYEYIGKKGKKC